MWDMSTSKLSRRDSFCLYFIGCIAGVQNRSSGGCTQKPEVLDGSRGPMGQQPPINHDLSDNSCIHVFYLSLMFSLHLYKNTEYSRVFTQSGNGYIRFLAPRLISCPEPFASSTPVDWNGSLEPEALLRMSLLSVRPHNNPQRNSV